MLDRMRSTNQDTAIRVDLRGSDPVVGYSGVLNPFVTIGNLRINLLLIGAPAIDVRGTITVNAAARTVSYTGQIGSFPWHEAYVKDLETGLVKPLYQEAALPGASMLNLIHCDGAIGVEAGLSMLAKREIGATVQL